MQVGPVLDPARILSCGHPPSPHGECESGTAVLPDKREVCYACADEIIRGLMRAGKRVTGYMSEDKKTINTWSGGKLADITHVIERSWRVHGVKRTMYYWKATGGGRKWYGSGGGPNMYTTMLPRKGAK